MARFVAEAALRPGVTAAETWRVRHRDGTWLHSETVAANLLEDPNVRGLVLNTRDVSERKELEDQLVHQAFHDGLTGLANRTRFTERVEQALATIGP
ncbi:MAG TPA: PAS domain S-box protein, partial [Actinomycetes bacterium]|nr:PAS domain S-box protein [Actinomycetes bacterium]